MDAAQFTNALSLQLCYYLWANKRNIVTTEIKSTNTKLSSLVVIL